MFAWSPLIMLVMKALTNKSVKHHSILISGHTIYTHIPGLLPKPGYETVTYRTRPGYEAAMYHD